MNNINKQTNALAKKITSIVTAIVLLATSATTVGCVRNKKSSNTITTTKSQTTTSNENNNLALVDDFDINDVSEVKQRAQEIYDLSNKDLSVDEIINIIYLVNGKYEKLDLNEEKTEFKKLQNIFVSLTDLLNDYVVNWVNNNKSKKIIQAYMLMSSTDKKSTITKDDAIMLSGFVNKYLNNLKNSNISNCEKYADKYYDFAVMMQENIEESKKVCNGYEWVVLTQIMVNNPLFALHTSKDNQNDLDLISKLAGTRGTAFAETVVAKRGIDKTEDLKEAQKEGNYGYKSPYTSGYNKQDAKKAEKIVETTTEKKKVVVNEGGKEIRTEKEQINVPTTNVVETTYEANSKDNKNNQESKDKEKNNSKEPKKNKEETQKAKEETTVMVTEIMIADVTTDSYEEVIESGGEVVSEYYVDDEIVEKENTKVKK